MLVENSGRVTGLDVDIAGVATSIGIAGTIENTPALVVRVIHRWKLSPRLVPNVIRTRLEDEAFLFPWHIRTLSLN